MHIFFASAICSLPHDCQVVNYCRKCLFLSIVLQLSSESCWKMRESPRMHRTDNVSRIAMHLKYCFHYTLADNSETAQLKVRKAERLHFISFQPLCSLLCVCVLNFTHVVDRSRTINFSRN